MSTFSLILCFANATCMPPVDYPTEETCNRMANAYAEVLKAEHRSRCVENVVVYAGIGIWNPEDIERWERETCLAPKPMCEGLPPTRANPPPPVPEKDQ